MRAGGLIDDERQPVRAVLQRHVRRGRREALEPGLIELTITVAPSANTFAPAGRPPRRCRRRSRRSGPVAFREIQIEDRVRLVAAEMAPDRTGNRPRRRRHASRSSPGPPTSQLSRASPISTSSPPRGLRRVPPVRAREHHVVPRVPPPVLSVMPRLGRETRVVPAPDRGGDRREIGRDAARTRPPGPV